MFFAASPSKAVSAPPASDRIQQLLDQSEALRKEAVPREGSDQPDLAKVERSDAEWRELLTPEQYEVTRQKETEPPKSGKYWDNKQPGVYRCVCCDLELFDAATKYESYSGWPSFWQPINEAHLRYEVDNELLWQTRTEVLCRRCDAHLGHVFPDGPQPTGLRYCLNSVALDFEPSEGDVVRD